MPRAFYLCLTTTTIYITFTGYRFHVLDYFLAALYFPFSHVYSASYLQLAMSYSLNETVFSLFAILTKRTSQ